MIKKPEKNREQGIERSTCLSPSESAPKTPLLFLEKIVRKYTAPSLLLFFSPSFLLSFFSSLFLSFSSSSFNLLGFHYLLSFRIITFSHKMIMIPSRIEKKGEKCERVNKRKGLFLLSLSRDPNRYLNYSLP